MSSSKHYKISILTTLNSFNQSYSIATVVINQARLLKKYSKYPIDILVLENCVDDYPKDLLYNIKKIIPVFKWDANKINNEYIPKIQNVLQNLINKGTKFFFCHDILLVDSYITYNEAIRRLTDINPQVKWYFWGHSGPSSRPINLNTRLEELKYTLPCNSKLVYLNYFDSCNASNMYKNSTISNVNVVYNPITYKNISEINDDKALEIEQITKFNKAYARVIYPFSSTRIYAKGVDKVLEILHCIKSEGKSVKFIGVNAHCNAINEQNTIDSLIKRFTSPPYCLAKEDLYFTSKYKEPEYQYSIDHNTVLDLYKMSNLFIFPSQSEVCPLTLQEAAITNNLIIANSDLPPMAEMIGFNGGLFFSFGSNFRKVSYGINNTFEDRMEYFKFVADNIIAELYKGFYQTNAMYNVLNKYSYKYIWQNQYRHLLHE